MSQLRVAMLSAVRHADDYLRILSADGRVEIVRVGDTPDADGWIIDDGRRVAERHGHAWTDDVLAGLSRDDVDLAVICSEPTRHAALALAAIERGIPVLVDKPVATTRADAELVDVAARENRVTTAVVNRTFAPALRRLRGWVDAGHIGWPRHLDMEFLASGAHFSTSVERPELVVDRRLSGGGELLNFLGYCVDALHFVTGLKVVEVMTFAGSLFSPAHITAGVEDTAVVSLELERGVIATVTMGRVARAPGFGPTATSLRVMGSHGYAVADDDRPAVSLFSSDGGVSARSFDGGVVALERYLDHVVGCAIAGRAPEYGARDAAETLAVVEAAIASAEQGRSVRVD